MINELQIECFLSVARHMSFSEAAKERYTTQPSISKQIKKLEENLGIPLFDRTSRRPELTEYGHKFFDFFSENEKNFLKLQAEALGSLSKNEYTLRIGFLQASSFSKDFRPVFDEFILEHPNYHFEVSSRSFGELNRLLSDGKLDIIFSVNEYVDYRNPDLRKEKILDVTKQVIYKKSLFPEDNQPISLDDFIDQYFFITNEFLNRDEAEAKFIADHPFSFTPHLRYVSNIENMIWNVKNGTGVAIMDNTVQLDDDKNDLGRIGIPLASKIVIAWLDVKDNPAINLFVRQFMNKLESKESFTQYIPPEKI